MSEKSSQDWIQVEVIRLVVFRLKVRQVFSSFISARFSTGILTRVTGVSFRIVHRVDSVAIRGVSQSLLVVARGMSVLV